MIEKLNLSLTNLGHGAILHNDYLNTQKIQVTY